MPTITLYYHEYLIFVIGGWMMFILIKTVVEMIP